MVLDQGAITALSALMGVSTTECRDILLAVAGHPEADAAGA